MKSPFHLGTNTIECYGSPVHHRYNVDEFPDELEEVPLEGALVAAEHHAHNSKLVDDAPDKVDVLAQQRRVAREGALDNESGVAPQPIVARDEALAEEAAQAPVGQGGAEEPLELQSKDEGRNG